MKAKEGKADQQEDGLSHKEVATDEPHRSWQRSPEEGGV